MVGADKVGQRASSYVVLFNVLYDLRRRIKQMWENGTNLRRRGETILFYLRVCSDCAGKHLMSGVTEGEQKQYPRRIINIIS